MRFEAKDLLGLGFTNEAYNGVFYCCSVVRSVPYVAVDRYSVSYFGRVNVEVVRISFFRIFWFRFYSRPLYGALIYEVVVGITRYCRFYNQVDSRC